MKLKLMVVMITIIELMRDAFGEEKFCYILVAELKNPPTTTPNGEGVFLFLFFFFYDFSTLHTIFVTLFSPSAILFCRK